MALTLVDNLCKIVACALFLIVPSWSHHDYGRAMHTASLYLQASQHREDACVADSTEAATGMQRFTNEVVDITYSLYTGNDSRHADEIRENLTSLLRASNVSSECANHILEVLQGIATGNLWALQMVDAAGKPGAGLLQLYWKWLGSYDQCLNITVAPGNASLPLQPFKTRYCLSLLPLQPASTALWSEAYSLWLGTCVPGSCSAQDVQSLLNSVLNATSQDLPVVQATTCQDPDLPMDHTAVAAIFVGGLLVLLVLMGTSYDIVVIQWPHLWPEVVAMETNPINREQKEEEEEGEERGSREATAAVQQHYLRSSEHTPLLDRAKTQTLTLSLEEERQSVAGRVLLAFSLYTNGSALLSTESPTHTLTCLHGLRFLSLTWAILAHTLLLGTPVTQNALAFSAVALKQWTFQVVFSAKLAADTFFAISGLLVTFLTLQEMDKHSGKINWIRFYLHRFWRLTPPYMLVLFLYFALFPSLGGGPVWPQQGLEPHCGQHWWTNLLYVNNLVFPEAMCMEWSWFLANVMQFYWLSPLIIIPLFRWRPAGYVMLLLFLLASTVTPGVLAAIHHLHPAFTVDSADLNRLLSYKPYCRMGPYVVGMATGYLLYRCQCQARLNKVVVVAGWLVSAVLALALVYGLYDETQQGPLPPQAVDSLYLAVASSVWGLAVCWVIFACVTGHGGFVNCLLSWRMFAPLARLTFMAYLVHPILISVFVFSQQAPILASNLNIAVLVVAMVTASYVAAFVLSLVLERPFLSLEHTLLPADRHAAPRDA